MKKIKLIYILAVFFMLSCGQNSSSDKENEDEKTVINTDNFVKVKDGKLVLKGENYTFVGTNFWYGGNLAAQGEEGKERLQRELDKLKEVGITNLRIQICSEGGDEVEFGVKPSLQPKQGEYNEVVFQGIDFLLAEMSKREMKAVLVLNNYWSWTGGMAKYQNWNGAGDIPYPSSGKLGSWDEYMRYADGFYENPAAIQAFRKHIEVVLKRVNTISQLAYNEDPTIMSWQLANEPRGGKGREKQDFLINWIRETSAFIKTIDTLHLVTTGSEGSIGHQNSIDDYKLAHSAPGIDYITAHLWPQNWSWFNPEKPAETIDKSLELAKEYIDAHLEVAKELNKPITLEEFGLARDLTSFETASPVVYRNRFFEFVFAYVTEKCKTSNLGGSNFWSWAGEGLPPRPGENWKTGDPFIGDPPHEAQGWYSVYETDTATVNIIRKYANK